MISSSHLLKKSLMENFIFCDMAILQIALGMNYHSRHVETSYTIFLFAVDCLIANLRQLSREQPHSPDVKLSVTISFRSKGHRQPRNEVGYLSPAEHLVGFELGTLQFNLNALTHQTRPLSQNFHRNFNWFLFYGNTSR